MKSSDFIKEAVTVDRSKVPGYPNDAATQKHRLATAKALLSDPKTDPDSRRAAAAIVAQYEKQGVAEGSLNEFAPGAGGGGSGRWYNDADIAAIVGRGWYEEMDVSGDVPKRWMLQQAQEWLEDNGYQVSVKDCKINDDDMDWYIEGVLQRGLAEGVAETLPMSDAVKVLKHYGADRFQTTTNELHFYKNGQGFSVDLVMNPDTTRSVTLSSLNSATRGLKGQGVAEGYSFKGGFPFDVDHMPGAVIRNRDETTDVVKTKNKDKWDDMVDLINDEVFDDMADFRTNSEGETVTGNSAVWAKWDNKTQTGWINRKGQQLKPWPVKEQGVDEAQSMGDALRNSLSRAEPGSKLDKKIRHHNDMVRRGAGGTMTSAPDGYHMDKKGMIRLGQGVAEGNEKFQFVVYDAKTGKVKSHYNSREEAKANCPQGYKVGKKQAGTSFVSEQGVAEGDIERTATGLKHTRDFPEYPGQNRTEFSQNPDRLNKSETGRLDKAFDVKWQPTGRKKEIAGDPTGVDEGVTEAELAEPPAPERKQQTQTKTKSKFNYDPFQQQKDQPIAKADPLDDLKKNAGVGSNKPEVNIRKASQASTLNKTAGLATDDMANMLGKMKNIEISPDLEPYEQEPEELLPSVDVNTQNLPAVAGQALQAAGVQDPEFHQVANLPGNMADQIRQLGKSLFGSLTMTPTKRIYVVANLGGKGPNTTQEVNAVANFLQKNGDDRGPGDIDFDQVMPGYKAQTHMYTAAGIRWMLVKDFAGQYIYCWPEDDSHDSTAHIGHDELEVKQLR